MNLIGAIVLIPTLTALVLLLTPRPSVARRLFVLATSVVQLALAIWLGALAWQHGALVLPLGGWGAELGIVLVCDLLAAVMLTLSSLTMLACLLFAFAQRPAAQEHPLQLPLMQFLISGINLAFVTGDLFNLFVAFEVMLISSYALLSLEANNRNIRNAWSYLAINLVATVIFLLGCGLAYNLAGTLNFAVIAAQADVLSQDPRLLLLALVLLVVFAIKAGLFPLYYWLPDSYPILPAPLAAFFGGVLTKVGVYLIVRMYSTVFPPDLPVVSGLLAWSAGLAMVLGVFGAVSRERVQHILSYHCVSQIGFIVLAVGFATPLGIAAAILYMIHYIGVKASLFLVGGALFHVQGTDRLAVGGGLWKALPWLGLGFLLQAMSLAGLPPFSGFWGKYLIVVAGLEVKEYVLVGMSIVASVLTLVSMLKIWLACFWRKQDEATAALVAPPGTRGMTATVGGMAAFALMVGLAIHPFHRVAQEAARQALDRSGYITAVIGARASVLESYAAADENEAKASATVSARPAAATVRGGTTP
jgi:multicomponent Na+:H+ antiporter subunit D